MLEFKERNYNDLKVLNIYLYFFITFEKDNMKIFCEKYKPKKT